MRLPTLRTLEEGTLLRRTLLYILVFTSASFIFVSCTSLLLVLVATTVFPSHAEVQGESDSDSKANTRDIKDAKEKTKPPKSPRSRKGRPSPSDEGAESTDE